jgi:glycosyltransferase involved in cell wall biosynthesis
LAQSFQDFLVYFIDDKSTDNSIEIVEKYDDPRICVFKKEKQSGIVDTLNLGLSKIESPYYVRMDGDDIAAPNRFELLLNFMKKNPEVDICGSSIQAFGIRNDCQFYEQSAEKNKANLIFSHSIGHASCIVKTALMHANNIEYTNNYWRLEDYDLFYRLKNIAITTSVLDVLYFYRQENYNVNNEIKEKMQAEYRHFYANIFKDMHFQYSEKDISLHMELAGKEVPNNSYQKYVKHVDHLMHANNVSKAFPAIELRTVLNDALVVIQFKLIDNNKLGFWKLLRINFLKSGAFKYYISTKILGRGQKA